MTKNETTEIKDKLRQKCCDLGLTALETMEILKVIDDMTAPPCVKAPRYIDPKEAAEKIIEWMNKYGGCEWDEECIIEAFRSDEKYDEFWAYQLNTKEKENEYMESLYDALSESANVSNFIHFREGMFWNDDGHEITVIEVNEEKGEVVLKEEWIAEDTGKPVEETYTYHLMITPSHDWRAFSPKHPEYGILACNAFNLITIYPEIFNRRKRVEDEPEMEDSFYDSPSATAGDYSPSSPWNAPGMSIKDFI